MERRFVTVQLTALEPADRKHLENPGAEGFLNANGGKNQGIPYFYFTDAQGKTIVTAMRPALGEKDKGGNVGCPVQPEEIVWWLECLKRASPGITEGELAAMKGAFETLRKPGG
jgi:hypothetical protein